MARKAEILKNVEEIVRGIAEECKMISKAAITAHGMNDKVSGQDTLTDSNLYDDLAVRYDMDSEMITILVNPYIKYIQEGKKPNEPFPWKLAVEVLADWCQRKLGTSDNTTIYFVWKNIKEPTDKLWRMVLSQDQYLICLTTFGQVQTTLMTLLWKTL